MSPHPAFTAQILLPPNCALVQDTYLQGQNSSLSYQTTIADRIKYSRSPIPQTTVFVAGQGKTRAEIEENDCSCKEPYTLHL